MVQKKDKGLTWADLVDKIWEPYTRYREIVFEMPAFEYPKRLYRRSWRSR